MSAHWPRPGARSPSPVFWQSSQEPRPTPEPLFPRKEAFIIPPPTDTHHGDEGIGKCILLTLSLPVWLPIMVIGGGVKVCKFLHRKRIEGDKRRRERRVEKERRKELHSRLLDFQGLWKEVSAGEGNGGDSGSEGDGNKGKGLDDDDRKLKKVEDDDDTELGEKEEETGWYSAESEMGGDGDGVVRLSLEEKERCHRENIQTWPDDSKTGVETEMPPLGEFGLEYRHHDTSQIWPNYSRAGVGTLKEFGFDGAYDTDTEEDEEDEAYLNACWGPKLADPPEGEARSLSLSPTAGPSDSKSHPESLAGSLIDIPRLDGSSGSTAKGKRVEWTALNSLQSSRIGAIEEPKVATAEALIYVPAIPRCRIGGSKCGIDVPEDFLQQAPLSTSTPSPPEASPLTNTPSVATAEHSGSTSPVTAPEPSTPPPITPTADDTVLVPVPFGKDSSIETNYSTSRMSTDSLASSVTIKDLGIERSNARFMGLNPGVYGIYRRQRPSSADTGFHVSGEYITSASCTASTSASASDIVSASASEAGVELHASTPVIQVTIEGRDDPEPKTPSSPLTPEAQLELDILLRKFVEALTGFARLVARQENSRDLLLVFVVAGFRIWQWFLDELACRVRTGLSADGQAAVEGQEDKQSRDWAGTD